jgi:protein-tyrosine phosphatase
VLSVLFVCTGNICRSPIAEALFRSRSGELGVSVSVRSAGSWAQRGNPATSNAIVAAREMGLEIEGHRARPLRAHLVRESDLVLGLAREHRDEVLELVPDAAPKTFTLKELAALLEALPPAPVHADRDAAAARIAETHRLRGGSRGPVVRDPDVRDPIGSALFAYRDVAWDIETAVGAMLIGLFGDRQGATKAAASEEG